MERGAGGISKPGNCHRIALAIHDFAGAFDQWRRVFGTGDTWRTGRWR
jgi:hypothetical protein